MDVSEKVGTTVVRKIQSADTTRACVIAPVQKMLDEPSFSNDFSLTHLTKVILYLQISTKKIEYYKEALLNKRIINSDVELEVKEAILDLEKNVKHLEEKMSMYKQSINDAIKSVDISNLEKYFVNDLLLFQSLVEDLLVVYEVPRNNTYYGKPIRQMLTDLGTLQSLEDSDSKLNRYMDRCKSMLSENEMFMESHNNMKRPEVEKNDMIMVQKSLQSLLQLCSILKSKIQ